MGHPHRSKSTKAPKPNIAYFSKIAINHAALIQSMLMQNSISHNPSYIFQKKKNPQKSHGNLILVYMSI